jgi:hypothetical protein
MIPFFYAHVKVHVQWASSFFILLLTHLCENKMDMCLYMEGLKLLKEFLYPCPKGFTNGLFLMACPLVCFKIYTWPTLVYI